MSFVDNKPFCLQTLSAYPPAASATGLVISEPISPIKLVFDICIYFNFILLSNVYVSIEFSKICFIIIYVFLFYFFV